MYICSDDDPRLAVYTHDDVNDDVHNTLVKTSTRDAALARDASLRKDKIATPDNSRTPDDSRRHGSRTESERHRGNLRDDPRYQSIRV